MTGKLPACARCSVNIAERSCMTDKGRGPDFCSMQTRKAPIERSLEAYDIPGI